MFGLAAAASSFRNFAEFDELLVRRLLLKLAELGGSLYVAALQTVVIPTATHFRDDSGTLDALGEATDHIGAALPVVLGNLDICSHRRQELTTLYRLAQASSLQDTCATLESTDELCLVHVLLVTGSHITKDNRVFDELFLADDEGVFGLVSLSIAELGRE